jgi:hypothetical protein
MFQRYHVDFRRRWHARCYTSGHTQCDHSLDVAATLLRAGFEIHHFAKDGVRLTKKLPWGLIVYHFPYLTCDAVEHLVRTDKVVRPICLPLPVGGVVE